MKNSTRFWKSLFSVSCRFNVNPSCQSATHISPTFLGLRTFAEDRSRRIQQPAKANANYQSYCTLEKPQSKLNKGKQPVCSTRFIYFRARLIQAIKHLQRYFFPYKQSALFCTCSLKFRSIEHRIKKKTHLLLILCTTLVTARSLLSAKAGCDTCFPHVQSSCYLILAKPSCSCSSQFKAFPQKGQRRGKPKAARPFVCPFSLRTSVIHTHAPTQNNTKQQQPEKVLKVRSQTLTTGKNLMQLTSCANHVVRRTHSSAH